MTDLAKIRIKIVDITTLQGIQAKLDTVFVGHPGQDWHVVTGPNGIVDVGLTPGDYVVTITSTGYITFDWPIHIQDSGEISQGLTPLPTGIAIRTSGREFTIGGQRYKPKMASDFLLIYKKLHGIDIKPIIAQRKEAGADFLRIFTCCRNIADLNPRNYDVQAVLGATLDDIHSFDMRAQVEGFADVQLIGLTIDEQHLHQNNVCSAIRSRGAVDLYDLGNEIDKNGIDANNFTKPTGVISSKGSLQNNKPPHAPYWDYGVYHPRRDGDDYYVSKYLSDITPQCEIYTGVEGEPLANIPVIPDEPIGFQSTNDSGHRANYPGFAYRLGSIYSMYLNGSCFHSTNGILSDLFDEVTMACAYDFFDGCDDARKGW
jgi:hypothetical protein